MKITNDFQTFSFKDLEKRVCEETYEFSGNLLFCWPYKWEENIERWEELVSKLATDIIDFTATRINWAKGPDLLPLIKDSIWMALFCAPKAWRESAMEDYLTYKKCLLFCTHFFDLYLIDDDCEKLGGNLYHSTCVKNTGWILQKIFSLKFETFNAVENDPCFLKLQAIPGFKSNYLAIFFDVVQEMQKIFNVSSEQMKYLAKSLGNLFEFQTWFGSHRMSHHLQKDLREFLRSLSVGFDVLVEFWMVLDGLFPAENIRSNVYWNRMYLNARKLGHMLNDIFSVQKEYEETHKTGVRVDNAILISMEVEKLTFKEALHKLIQEHNDVLVICRNEMESIQQHQDFLWDLTEKEKKLYFDSLEGLGITLSHLAQTHLRMSRYKNNVQYEFNSDCQNMLNKLTIA